LPAASVGAWQLADCGPEAQLAVTFWPSTSTWRVARSTPEPPSEYSTTTRRRVVDQDGLAGRGDGERRRHLIVRRALHQQYQPGSLCRGALPRTVIHLATLVVVRLDDQPALVGCSAEERGHVRRDVNGTQTCSVEVWTTESVASSSKLPPLQGVAQSCLLFAGLVSMAQFQVTPASVHGAVTRWASIGRPSGPQEPFAE